MGSNSRARGRIGTLAVAALTFGGLVAAGPAYAADSAATEASDSTLRWGFRQSFRNYVGQQIGAFPPIGPLPAGERIQVLAPAQFDLDAQPAVPSNPSSPNETLPYLLPVHSTAYSYAGDFEVRTHGGVEYRFPSHAFEVTLENVGVAVAAGDASVIADVTVVIPENDFEFEPGTYEETDVVIGEVSDTDVSVDGDLVTVSGTGVTLTAAGASGLQGFLDAGDVLDDFTLSFLAAPSVALSASTYSPDGGSDVTVTGRGFYHGNAIGQRPPLAGKAAGAYVVVGYFPEVWRPSVDPRAARPAVSAADRGQKWAVPAENIPVPISPASGGIELEPDGTFSAVLTVDKSVIDAAAAEKGVTEGSYGIYTYPGSGAAAPSFETYTPITFVSAPVVTAAPKNSSVTAGSTATFTAAVTGADSLQWQSRRGTGVWQDIAGETAGTLKVTPTAVAESGTQYRVVASNAGGTVESAAATLTVTKASAAVAVKVKKSFRFAAGRTATVTVDAPEGLAPATGAVIVKAGSKVVGKGTLRGGAAKVTLTTKLLPGTRKLVAEFAGNADLEPATSSAVTVSVKKAKAKTAAKLAKKNVKAGKRAVVRVRVTSANVKPGGKVKITVRQGKKTVRTLTVRVKAGKVTKVRLPRLAKGKYQVRAQYQGTKKVAKKASKKVVLRVR